MADSLIGITVIFRNRFSSFSKYDETVLMKQNYTKHKVKLANSFINVDSV